MIFRAMGKNALVDYEVLLLETGRPLATIRKHCKPATTDPKTGVLLFDIKLAREALAKVRTRKQKSVS